MIGDMVQAVQKLKGREAGRAFDFE